MVAIIEYNCSYLLSGVEFNLHNNVCSTMEGDWEWKDGEGICPKCPMLDPPMLYVIMCKLP